MTLSEALGKFSSLRRGCQVAEEDLISFISELDATVKAEISDTHEGASVTAFTPYTSEDGSRELLVPSPYDSIYLRYLEMMTDYRLGENSAYNSAAAMFSAVYSSYRNHYNSTHMPKSERIKLAP